MSIGFHCDGKRNTSLERVFLIGVEGGWVISLRGFGSKIAASDQSVDC